MCSKIIKTVFEVNLIMLVLCQSYMSNEMISRSNHIFFYLDKRRNLSYVGFLHVEGKTVFFLPWLNLSLLREIKISYPSMKGGFFLF